MIISRAEIESAVSVFRASAKRKPRASTGMGSGPDRYEHGSELGAFSALAGTVASEPLYRAPLVSDLQRRISEGRYYVPAEAIVEKLIGRLMVDALAA